MSKDKTPAKREANEVALSTGVEYALLKKTPEQVRDVIQVNLEGQQVGVFDLERVRIPDGKTDFWTLPTVDGSEAVKEIEGVIVYRQAMRAMWMGNEIDNSPPNCSSKNGEDGFGIRSAGEDIPSPQECKTCPLGQFGSADVGAGQKCKAVCAVFLLQADSILPILLMLPPTSLTAIKKYTLALARIDLTYFNVVSKIGLEKAKNPAGQEYNVATFTAAKDEEGKRLSFPDEGSDQLRSYHTMIKGIFGVPATV